MKNYYKPHFIKALFLCLLVIPYLGLSQNATTAAGSTVEGSDHVLSYTIGEAIISNYASANFTVTNGVIQPNSEIVNSAYDFDNNKIDVFPNPVVTSLIVQSENQELINFEIFTLDGRLVLEGKIKEGVINMQALTTGSYVLKIKTSLDHYSTLIQKMSY